jgi:formylglycine-generating enzyme required for sulfatase activity
MILRAVCIAAVIAGAGCQSARGQNVSVDTMPANIGPRNLKEMALVPGGTFLMGGVNANERPKHTVTLSAFYIGKYEVTVGAFRAFVEATGFVTTAETDGRGGDVNTGSKWERKTVANWKNPYYFRQTDEHPVVLVSRYDAAAYCNWLSEQEGLTPAYTVEGTSITRIPDADGYRLPTEAEWEYAARGGAGSPGNYRYAGNNNIYAVAWYNENSNSRTHEVGKKAPNGLGLYDMSGNVWEMVWDWYGDYSKNVQTDPLGPSSGTQRIRRGGGWDSNEDNHRTTARFTDVEPEFRASNVGFRIVRSYQPNHK